MKNNIALGKCFFVLFIVPILLFVGLNANAYASGTVTVEIYSCPDTVRTGERVDIQIRIKYSGDNDGPWQVTDIKLRDDDGITWNTIASASNPLNIYDADTWYYYTFHDVTLSNWEDSDDGVELYAWGEVDDNDLNGYNPDNSSIIKNIRINDPSVIPNISNFTYEQQLRWRLYIEYVAKGIQGQTRTLWSTTNEKDKMREDITNLATTLVKSTYTVKSLLNINNMTDAEFSSTMFSNGYLAVTTLMGDQEGIWDNVAKTWMGAGIAAIKLGFFGDPSAFALYCSTETTKTLIALYNTYDQWRLKKGLELYTVLNDVLYVYYSFGSDIDLINTTYGFNGNICDATYSDFECFVYNAINDGRINNVGYEVDYSKLLQAAKLYVNTVDNILNSFVPSKPDLYNPPDGVNPSYIYFSWSKSICKSCGQVSYNLEVHEGNTTIFKADGEIGMIKETSFALTNRLKPNTTYSWAIYPKSQYNVWNLKVNWKTFTTGVYISNSQPMAIFSAIPNSGYTSTFFKVDSSSSYDPDKDPLQYRWNWGDSIDFTPISTSPVATHQYSTPGTYDITLVVSDDKGTESYASKTVTVSPSPTATNQPPSVSITSGPSGDTTDSTPTFYYQGSDSDGTIVGYYRVIGSKDLIDGDSPNPAYYNTGISYTSSSLTNGNYTFHVRAKDNQGGLSPIVSRSFAVAVPIFNNTIYRVEPETSSLKPGDTYNFTISYKNMSNVDWKSDPNSSNYVELHSVSSNGNPTASYLYPGDGKWLDNNKIRVTGQTNATVAGSPSNESAWFQFTGKVPDTAIPNSAPVSVYFRLYNPAKGYFGEIAQLKVQVVDDTGVIPPVTKLKWDFNSNTAEGWTPINDIPNPFSFTNGEMFMFISGNDPYIYSPSISISPSEVNYLKITGRHFGGVNTGRVYLLKEGMSYFNDQNSKIFSFQNGAPNKTIIVPLTSDYFPDIFNGDGKRITKIRIDPVDQGSGGIDLIDEVNFDAIELGKDTTPPVVSLNTPVIGEYVKGGSPYTISWTASDSLGIDYVNIQTITNGNYVTIASRIQNSGFFSWTPPDENQSYSIKISAYDYAGNRSEALSGIFNVTKSSTVQTGIYEINGYVRDINSQPLKGVTVKITNVSTGTYYPLTTDESGFYTRSVPAGTYEVYVYIDGYTFPSNTVGNIQLYDANTSATINFIGTLITYSFKGYVKLPDGTGIGGINISVAGEGRTYSATTNPNGYYTFSLPPAEYNIVPSSLTYAIDPIIRTLYVGNTYYGLPDQNFTASLKNGDFVSVGENAGIVSQKSTYSAAWGDYDNDGFEDLYLANDTLDSSRNNILYHNMGNGTFEDVSVQAGVADDGHSFGSVWVDYNGDGYLDIYVTNAEGANKLYRNDGNGTFTDVAPSLGVALADKHKMCTCAADYDNDGDLDLFVCISNDTHRLFKNNGGTFEEVSAAADMGGLADVDATSCSWADYDRDGNIDLYIGRQWYSGQLYKNSGNGTFSSPVTQTGSFDAYGVAWGDFNNDGYPDLFVNSSSQNKLFRNNQDGTFTDITSSSGISYSTGSYGGVTWFDYDNDGWLDLYIGIYGGKLYHNNGNEIFSDVTTSSGAGALEVPNVVATADYDNNGTSDLFIGQLNQNLMLKGKNFGNRYLKVKLVGESYNRFGVGTLIRVYANGIYQYRTVTAGSGTGDMDSMTALFGLGTATSSDVRVFWPDGTEDEFYDQGSNYTKTIIKGSGQDSEPPSAIVDLIVEEITTDSVTIKWTAPGDDGNTRMAHNYDIRYATFNIDEGNWDSTIETQNLPMPLTAGSYQTYTLTGLDKNKEYYIAVKAFDERGNASGISNVVYAKTKVGASIFDLSAGNISVSSVGLNWTVPEDSIAYDIRYSTSIITESNWAVAPQVMNEPEPLSTGSLQSIVVDKLNSNTQYYFAAKVLNSDGSALSNIATATTLLNVTNQLTLFKKLTPPDNNQFYGGYITKAGDLNGDGYDDLVISHVYKAVYIYWGGATLNSNPALTLSGGSSTFYADWDSVSVGDINGDAYNDVVVGEDRGGANGKGRVYVYLGGPNMDGVADLVLEGGASDYSFGISVIADGDINGDTYDDIIVSTEYCPTKIYIYLGRSNINNINTSDRVLNLDCPAWEISPAVVKDLNNDSIDDLILTDRYRNKIFIYEGKQNIYNIGKDFEVTSECASGYVRTKVSYDTGDINHDGFNDILAGFLGSCSKAFILYGGNSFSPTFDISFQGGSSGDDFGYSVASIGDTNRDGYEDFAVSADNADGNAQDSGKVYVYLGGDTLDFVPDIEISGESYNKGLGTYVRGIGDINNDGYDDLAATAEDFNGEVYIYLGKANIVPKTDSTAPAMITNLSADATVPGQITLTWTSPGDDGMTGAAAYYDIRYLASPLDLARWSNAINIIGEPAPSPSGTQEKLVIKNLVPNTKYYFAIRAVDEWGNISGLSNVVEGVFINYYEVNKNLDFGNFQYPIFRGDADFNNDGYRDIMVGDPQYDVTGDNEGAVFIYFGGTIPDNQPDIFFFGGSNYQNFGSKVLTGDFNGDGYFDALIYAGSYSGGYKFSLYRGGNPMDTVADQEIILSSSPNQIIDLQAGDINGDGKDDVIVATQDTSPSTTNSGRIDIFLGGNLISSTPTYTINGLSNELLGYSLSIAGDVNKDGYKDILVGTNIGKAYLFFGGASFNTVPDLIFNSIENGDGFGRAVSGAGDFNGDGFKDIVIGAPWTAGILYDGGAAYIFLGGQAMDSNYDLKIESPPLYGQNFFADYVSSAGDINKDGYDDIMMYQSGESKYSVCIVFGGSDMDPIIDVKIDNVWIGSRIQKMVSAGDINGDGYDEILTRDSISVNKVNVYSFVPNINPYMPNSPFPQDQAIGQPLSISLSWAGGDPDLTDMVSYDLYFGKSGEMSYIGTLSATSYNTGLLDYFTSYSWQVIAKDNHGHSVEGTIWFFQTEQAPLPIAPDYLQASLDGSNINLTWSDNSTNETGFTIERKIGADGTYMQIVTTPAISSPPLSSQTIYFAQSNSTSTPSYTDTSIQKGNIAYYYRVKAFNYLGDSDYSNEATVIVPNNSPLIVSNPPITISQGETYLYKVVAVDQDSDELNYSAVQKPADMIINPTTGLIMWTPVNSDVGDHQVVIKVSDGYLEDQQSFIVTVLNTNDAPQIISFLPLSQNNVIESESSSQFMVVASDSDQNTILTYQWYLDNVVQSNNDNYFTYNPNSGDIGNHILYVKVSDGSLTDQNEWVITVQDTTKPTSLITYPSNNSSVIADTVTIKGTASDIGSPLFNIEVSTDGGATWNIASGTTSWSYAWAIPSEGIYVIRSRATDNTGNVEIPSSGIIVTAYNRQPSIVSINGRQLLINGNLFIIKGISYSPVPIGDDPETIPPYGDYFTSDYRSIYDRDLPQLRQIGANAFRLWNWNNTADHLDFLDKVYNGGVNPLYIIAGFWMNSGLDIDPNSSNNVREQLKEQFRDMISTHKNHPAILMWAIGDEINTEWMYGNNLNNLLSLINEMAAEARTEDPNHPVTVALADMDFINTISVYDSLLTSLDVWAVKAYRGNGFGSLFNDYSAVSEKPLFILEYGIDAYDNINDTMNEDIQAQYSESLWDEIKANSTICIGGTVMYSDEWWRGKQSPDAMCLDNDPAIHGVCGFAYGSFPDSYVNEEWWGIMQTTDNGTNPDIVTPRQVYYTIQGLWLDTDEDGSPDASDNCPSTPNSNQIDTDSDDVGDACDNCSLTYNPGQEDTDSDDYGNMCDADLDNDGFVGPNDYNMFGMAWWSAQGSPNWNPDADFDGDGFVGPNDYNILGTRWWTVAPWK